MPAYCNNTQLFFGAPSLQVSIADTGILKGKFKILKNSYSEHPLHKLWFAHPCRLSTIWIKILHVRLCKKSCSLGIVRRNLGAIWRENNLKPFIVAFPSLFFFLPFSFLDKCNCEGSSSCWIKEKPWCKDFISECFKSSCNSCYCDYEMTIGTICWEQMVVSNTVQYNSFYLEVMNVAVHLSLLLV